VTGSEGASASRSGAPGHPLLDKYEAALPQVYGYLRARCDTTAVAEDLTAETFLAAAESLRRPNSPDDVSVGWLIGIARHKLADHWRRQAREDSRLRIIASRAGRPTDDPWDARLDAVVAHDTLRRLAPQHRAALTLRYVDDLPVREVADALDRSLHATEALLVRARAAFRHTYPHHQEATGQGGDHG
jgi:RNA polymerase sigma-70 factor (ECF subfamily)